MDLSDDLSKVVLRSPLTHKKLFHKAKGRSLPPDTQASAVGLKYTNT